MTGTEQRGPFRLGDWTVEPQLNRVSRNGRHIEVEPKSMAVLTHLAGRPGQVISSDEFIEVVWHGRPMGDNPVHRCVSRLRNALGDDARHPRYIATVQRKGYRLVANVEPLESDGDIVITPARPGRRSVALLGSATVVVAVAAIVIAAVLRPAAPIPSTAVLPFEALTDDAVYLAKGISAEVRTMLGSVDGLFVASRSASAQFPPGTDPKWIGETLNVLWVLEGTVRKDGNEIRVTAQLIDTETRFEAWSESYKGTDADIFDMQLQIATAVTNSVVSTIPPEWRLAIQGTDVISAFDEFLRGQAALEQPRDDQNLTAAEQHYQKALEHDPNYARAYAGLCRTYIAWFVFGRATDYVDKAETACRTALSLDASLSEVPLALGALYRNQGKLDDSREAFQDALKLDANSADALTELAQTLAELGDLDGAEAAFENALAAQPNDWLGYSRFGLYFFKRGRYAEAARMYQRAVDLQSPHNANFVNLGAALFLMGDFEMAAKAYERSLSIRPNRSAYSNLGTLYYYLGRYDDAVAQYRQAIDLKPQDYVMWGNLGDALGRSTMPRTAAAKAYDQAIELARRHLDVNPRDGTTQAMLGSYLAHLGHRDHAETSIGQALENAPDEPYVHYYASVIFAILGRPEPALSELERAVELGYPVVLIKDDPEFLPLRSLPGYDAMLANAASAK